MRVGDLVAGVSVAGLLLPEAVAYAGIAGLAPQRAILAAVIGCLVYAAAGRSRFAIVSPTSSSAAILAAALASFSVDDATKMTLATLAVALAGIVFVIASVARLGGLAGFISRPVIRGFAFGLAIIIILKQLPVLVGIDARESNIFGLAWTLMTLLPAWHGASVATGLIALAALLGFRRMPLLPGAFLVLVGGIAASLILDLPAYGVAAVGLIDASPQWPTPASLSFRQVSQLGELVLPLVLILFAESWGTMRTFALRHGDIVEPRRELAALGLANLASAAVQGMPVGAGFSAASASEAAGATSRMTAVIAGVGLAVLIAFAAPLVAHLPQPVLAAVVIAALTHALDPGPLIRLWKLDRDQYIALAAVAGVLVLGVVDGMLVAIALSLAALMRRMAAPLLVRLGRLKQGHDYVDLKHHPEAVAPAGIAVFRPAEPVFFANAERIFEAMSAAQAAEPSLRAIIISLEETFDLDSTSLDALCEFEARMTARGVLVGLARVRSDVLALVARSESAVLADMEHSYSVDDAVEAMKRRLSASR